MALAANVNRDAKKRPRPSTPADFNPHERKAGAKLGVAELKDMPEGEGGGAERAAVYRGAAPDSDVRGDAALVGKAGGI